MHIPGNGVAFDVMDGLELPIVAECYVVRWLFRPAVPANRTEVFTIFNTVYTEGYKGRSMSVSDVVEFKYSDTKDFFFYCDSFGFKLIHFNSKSEAEGGGRYA